jgi:hypothetical protein
MDPESVAVTAGLGGFVSFFLLAVALYFLMRNMNARMRRMAYREEQEAKADASGPGSERTDFSGPESGPTKGTDEV